MNDDVARHIERKKTAFRAWSAGRHFRAARLVQYTGPECGGGINIRLDRVEFEIEGGLGDGFDVDWNERDGTLFLCVSENVKSRLVWEKVFQEQHLADIDAMNREAGIDEGSS